MRHFPDEPRPLRRRLRRLRSVAALAATALVAPLGLAGVASVTTALPAAAAPTGTGPIVVTGDAAARNTSAPGAWTFFGGTDFDQLKSLLADSANFGPSGTVKATFQLGTPVTEVTDAALANVDVYFSSAVETGYTLAERQALQRFVDRGGVLIANINSPEFDVTDGQDRVFFRDVMGPASRWEDYTGTHSCQQATAANGYTQPATPDCAGSSVFSAPAAAQVTVSSHPIMSGPFGAVTSFRNWHTVTAFTGTDIPEAQTLATLSIQCDQANVACARTAAQIENNGTPGDTSDDCDLTITNSADPKYCAEQPYNNNLGANAPVLEVIDFGSSQWGAGAVVLTSDVDTFSNSYGLMQPGNRTLALNTFAWIAQNIRDTQTTPPATPTERFTPVPPNRLLDTRNGIGGPAAKLGPNETRNLTFPAGVNAVALNITGTNSSDLSFLVAYPGGTSPTASNVNLVPGKDVSNSTVVRVGAGGVVTIANGPGSTDAIVDIVGTYQSTAGDVITSLAPQRLVDSRTGLGGVSTPIGPGESREIDVLALAGGAVPNDASGVVLNVTATNASTGGFFTVYPSDLGGVPGTSNVNFQAGSRAVPGLVFTELSADGKVSVYNGIGTADVIVDLFGYFAPPTGSTGLLAPVTPARLLDTRNASTVDGKFVGGGPLGADVVLDIAGRPGMPATGVSAVVLNVTVNEPTAQGFLTVWNEGTMPTVSNLNFEAGQTVANLVAVKVGADGKVRFHANVGQATNPGNVQVIADVVGWYN